MVRMGRKKKTKLRWGETKIWTKPMSDQKDHIFRFKCDLVCQEIQQELRQAVIIYTPDQYTQEELLILSRGGK